MWGMLRSNFFHLNSSKVTPEFLMVVSGQDTPLNSAPTEISETISIDARDDNMHKNARKK